MAARGRYLVPNLIAYKNLKENGRRLGYPELGLAKLGAVLEHGSRSIEIARRAGVKIAYGSDLSRAPELQSDEFLIRGEIEKPIDIIRSATLVGAEVVRLPGKIGEIATGAFADLLVIDGNPLKDVRLLTDQGRHMPAIMANGVFVKNALGEVGGLAKVAPRKKGAGVSKPGRNASARTSVAKTTAAHGPRRRR